MPRPATIRRSDSGALPLLSQPAFVGRERELAALGRALAGPSAVVLVDGEAGIGKSRLVTEFLASVPRCRALVANCPPLRQPHTLGPVLDAVRQASSSITSLKLSGLAGALRPLIPEWADRLPPAPEPLEDATAARHRLFHALAELFGCLGVAILVVEDAHWADEASLEFLLFLTSLRPRRVSLLVTYRGEDVPPGSLLRRLSSRPPAGGSLLRLALGPLDVADTARLVSSMMVGAQVSDEFAAFVHQRTDGVPLAVEESVRLMATRGDVVRRDSAWIRRNLTEIDVPPTVRDSVLERTERLSPEAEAILRAASVLSDPAGEATLMTISGLPAAGARAGMAAALQCGLLAEDGRGLLSFRHVLAARAVYDAVPPLERRTMHLRAGLALESQAPRPVAQLASHFREAGEVGKWCQYAEQAADLALASGDEVTAVLLLHGLLTGAGLPVHSVVRLARKIPFGSFTGDARCRDIVRTLRSALHAGVASQAEEGELRHCLGRMLLQLDEWETARPELELAIPHLERDPARARQVMMLLANPRGGTCPRSVHLDWLRRAAGLGMPSTQAERLRYTVDRATALVVLGEPARWEEATRIPGDAPTWPERREIIRCQLNIGATETVCGRYGDAQRRLARALVLASRYQHWRYYGSVLAALAHVDWFTGTWAGLAARVAALEDDENLSPIARLELHLVGALLYAATGMRGEGERRLRYVYEEAQRRADMELVCEPSAALAMMELADGRPEEALRITDWPIRVVAGKGLWLWGTDIAPARVAALAATGSTGQAADLVDAFARGLTRCGAPVASASLTLCWAIVARAGGRLSRAAALFGQAAVAWQRLPRPYDALLAREHRAECLLALGQDGAALAMLSDVREELHGLGAQADADRVARQLREHGVAAARVWRGGRRGYGDKLSPRELEVVRLVQTGLSNREVAKVLCRSHNTVATQLKSAMRKLHVSSRTALAVIAVEAGVLGDPSMALADALTASPDGAAVDGPTVAG